MSAQSYVLVLAAGAALLALWIMLRYASFGPRSLVWAIIHTILATLLLRLMPLGFDVIDARSVPGGRYIVMFGIALPLLVYAFLSGGWTLRAALGTLRS